MLAAVRVVEIGSELPMNAPECDLWWALRGGDGGNFGVVLEADLKIESFGQPYIVAGELIWQDPQAFSDALALIFSQDDYLPDGLTLHPVWHSNDGLLELTVLFAGTMKELVNK